MRQDHLRRHAAEDEGHGKTEEAEMILAQESGVRGPEPGRESAAEEEHRRPLEENGGDGEVLRSAGFDDIEDAGREVGNGEGDEENCGKEVFDAEGAEDVVVADEGGDGLVPDLGAVEAGADHEEGGEEEAFCGPVEVA